MANDQQLLIELKNKSQTAWEQLHRLYGEMLKAVCRHFFKDPQLVEDIAADSILKVWEKAPDLNSTEVLKAYLIRAVGNECVSQWRKAKKEELENKTYQVLLFSTTNGREQDDAMTAEFNRVEFLQKAKQEVAQLPPGERTAFQAWLEGGRNYDYAVRKLGRKYQTICNQVCSAKKKLRAALGPCRYWDDDTNRYGA